jgi:hypothetical protein
MSKNVPSPDLTAYLSRLPKDHSQAVQWVERVQLYGSKETYGQKSVLFTG